MNGASESQLQLAVKSFVNDLSFDRNESSFRDSGIGSIDGPTAQPLVQPSSVIAEWFIQKNPGFEERKAEIIRELDSIPGLRLSRRKVESALR